jgi:hypothetical protein
MSWLQVFMSMEDGRRMSTACLARAPQRWREQGDAGGNCKTPVEWPALFTYHSNPEKPRMRVKLQLVMCNDQGDEETVTDVITLNKNNQRIEHLGLTLAESKQR